MKAGEEEQHLRSVEEALIKLLNDEIAEADQMLAAGESSFHYLGRGISSFIASMLGAEKELLKDAAAKSQLAEKKCWDAMKVAEREPAAFRSVIYPPGTEYLLCYCVAMLTSAIAGVLTGSISEAIKGFYKLRKAYITLDGIMEAESNYLKQLVLAHGSGSKAASIKSVNSTKASNPVDIQAAETMSEPDGAVYKNSKAALEGIINDQSLLNSLTKINSKEFELDPATSTGIFTNHMDIYIHSGTRLCYGLLLIVFSMIENPLFTKILYIVGFKGDRDRGTRLLWQATHFANFNSAIAGIALLGYYNGLIGFCDILPTDPGAEDDLSAFPRARCRALLTEMRGRYPESRLWKMEEARTHSFNRNLPMALEILTENSNSNMKQIAVINMFEKSLVSMCIHDYALCAESWNACGELSTWSPTLYAYMAGCAYLELYRNTRLTDPSAAQAFKAKATEYIRKGPPLAGKQKVMSKQLPFDVYIVRKVEKWEERAKEWDVDLADAIGASPLVEMMYFWNGIKKQSSVELQKSLDLLDWQRTSTPEKFRADFDESAIEALLRAAVMRNQGHFEESREILQKEILCHDKYADLSSVHSVSSQNSYLGTD